MTLMVEVHARTHVGAVRENNEDSILVADQLLCDTKDSRLSVQFANPTNLTVAVADGMGGHLNGELASRFVLKELSEKLCHQSTEFDLDQILKTINHDLHVFSLTNKNYARMGTTLAGILIQNDQITVFNVGDSQVFSLERGYLQQLSRDDNAPGIDKHGKRSNVLLQCFGGNLTLESIKPHLRTQEISEKIFIICSDGLTDMMTLDDMEALLTSDFGQVTSQLVDKAIVNGGKDNISVVIVQIALQT